MPNIAWDAKVKVKAVTATDGPTTTVAKQPRSKPPQPGLSSCRPYCNAPKTTKHSGKLTAATPTVSASKTIG